MLLEQDKRVFASASIGPYETEVVETLAELRALEPEWRQFLTSGVSGNSFFNDPAQILLRLELEPQLVPWILVLRCGRQIRCIAPFFLHDTRLKLEFSVIRLGSLPLRMLKVFGAAFIVAAEEDIERCFAIVFEHLWQQRSKFALIFIEHLHVTTPLWDFCHSTFAHGRRFRWFLASSQIDTVHQIRLPSTHDKYLAEFNPKTRQSLRRKTRILCNERRARLEQFSGPGQVPQFLQQLNEVYRDTWQANLNGYRPRDTEPELRFLTGVAQRGWLRSYLLVNDQGPLAFLLGYQYDGIFYYYETGYRQTHADFGPGLVLTHLVLEDLFRDNSPRLVDFILGDHPYKRSFSNTQHGAAYVYLVPLNRWRMILRVQTLLHRMSRLAIRTLSVLKVDRMLRKMRRQSRR